MSDTYPFGSEAEFAQMASWRVWTWRHLTTNRKILIWANYEI